MGSTFLPLHTKRAMPDSNPVNGSSKRSRPTPPPLPVPPGHSCFRLLCHASRIGGVIGKAGAVIKQLQQSTRSKIRIEEAPPEFPDRVITIVGPKSVTEKIELNKGEEFDVSKGQEALLKVFERVLDVAAENSGTEAVGLVSCRLLAEAKHAGSVIGKGGKVVEKMRKDTGSKISVLKDKLPAVAAPTEEIVEIEGDVLAVKKALMAVSHCLQECPPVNKTKVTERKKLGTVPQATLLRPIDKIAQETLLRPTHVISDEILRRPIDVISQETVHNPYVPVPEKVLCRSFEPISQDTLRGHIEGIPQDRVCGLYVDNLSQHNSLKPSMPNSSVTYASGVNHLSLDSEMVPNLGTKVARQEVVFKILCSNDRIGGVIGKGGTIIRGLQTETGSSITIGAIVADCDERLITVSASENPELQYSPAQRAAVLVLVRSLESGVDKAVESGLAKGSIVTARLVVPSNQVGCLLGKGGVIISEMRMVTGTSIRILLSDEIPKCVSENDQVVQISGEYLKVKDAVYHVTGRLRDNLFSSKPKTEGTKSRSSIVPEYSPYGRLMDSTPVGLDALDAVSHNLDRHTIMPNMDAVSHRFSGHMNLSHDMDDLGISHSSDHPFSPGMWSSEPISGVNLRGMTDVSRGLSSMKAGLEFGSGSKSAIVTNTTVEIRIPEDVIGSVYGENGRNLARLREISGAKVIVHEPRLGTTDRIIVISGTPNQTQAAQSLLQAFILTGSSQ